ncbi:hypothetical protein WH96_11905 [Kiloniella spongiae]|uniref:Solute-binding protein family 3/N-terminal domain-containing protein n=1 Tax=Kiloniella spongiae TaxID=1489064 RepID=A0A0H2MD38_9PROT|nr:transporter substrate-binding domain-containing protein [Kiloniella spongiae]KLN60434.1 hypothetical protein WH96_11905 [Kiloniella spongiae]
MKLFSFFVLMTVSLTSYGFAAGAPLKAVVLAEKPWGFYNESGHLDGITVSYFKTLAKFLGEPIEIVLVPEQRLIHGIEKGKYDLTVTFPEYLSEEFVTSLEPTIRLDKMLVGLKGVTITSTNDIEKLRLAVVRGTSTGSWIDHNRSIKKVKTANFTEALWLLKKGRVDVVTATKQVIHASLPKVGMTVDDIGEPYLLSCQQAILMISNASRKVAMMPMIKKAAKDFKNSPEWKALLLDAKKLAPHLSHSHNHSN